MRLPTGVMITSAVRNRCFLPRIPSRSCRPASPAAWRMRLQGLSRLSSGPPRRPAGQTQGPALSKAEASVRVIDVLPAQAEDLAPAAAGEQEQADGEDGRRGLRARAFGVGKGGLEASEFPCGEVSLPPALPRPRPSGRGIRGALA